MEEEVKEKMLWDHSERLAIAFALINTGPDSNSNHQESSCMWRLPHSNETHF